MRNQIAASSVSDLVTGRDAVICQFVIDHQRMSFPTGATFVFLLMVIAMSCGCGTKQDVPQQIRRSRIALIQGKLDEAEQIAAAVPETDEQFCEAMLIAGEAATKGKRPDAAIGHYQNALESCRDTDQYPLVAFSLAEVLLHEGRLAEAEALYREIYIDQPNNLVVNERLAFLLSLTARQWESLEHYFVMVRSGEADFRELAVAADVGRAIEQPEFIRKSLEKNPDGILVRLAHAYQLSENGDDEAKELLEALVEEDPELLPAQALLGDLLFHDQDVGAFHEWHSKLPPSADGYPDIWFIRGQWARSQSDLQTAANCLVKTVQLADSHREAFYMLGQVLTKLRAPHAEEVVQYSDQLVRLTQQVDTVLTSDGSSLVAMKSVAEILESLGRFWEACAWAVVAQARQPAVKWPAEILSRHAGDLTDDLPRIMSARSPVKLFTSPSVDFGRWLEDRKIALELGHADAPSKSVIQFTDRGLFPFQYHNAEDLNTEGMRMFEQTGGGVGIIDLDNDLCPDIYLTQGGRWETGDSSPTPDPNFQDSLFRNSHPHGPIHDGFPFQAVDSRMLAAGEGFGQGCCVGDFNNDGFDDLYIANVGGNRLLEGNGDGTFQDVTEEARITESAWTVSVMMCDLNADGFADLFDTNYVDGPDVFERICNGKSCSPRVFDGAPDRVWMGRGNGTFVESSLPVQQGESKGLGVASFRTAPNQRSSVFIANDQVANHLLANSPAENDLNLQFKNEALMTGLAYNENGVAMACMGVAVEDFDSNGLPDLFVTNFENEPNTLYLQDAPGVFRDATRISGLFSGSLSMTGWGTQPLDADLDGRPDLVIANGHVDDYTAEGGSFRMKPQFYHQQGERFELLDPDQLGGWFAKEYLGRGLARIDWNRDGKPEFVCSVINEPVALLENTTSDAGHCLKVQLQATTTERDAIGASVKVTTSDSSMTRQLFAGDGYMASNERVLTFGLGPVTTLQKLEVMWPSGAISRVDSPEVDRLYVIVEGSPLGTMADRTKENSVDVQVVDDSDRPKP